MEYKLREYPQFSACGLNCGLCPRYYTDGPSRCPGCAGEGFSDGHCSCSVLGCCQRNGFEYCFECEEFPCKKYDGADLFDSFITHKNQFIDMDKAKSIGMDAYAAELNKKITLLEKLLESYNDGRRKSFFCTVVNLLDLQDINEVMKKLEDSVEQKVTRKEAAAEATRLFEEVAANCGISLRLRKK